MTLEGELDVTASTETVTFTFAVTNTGSEPIDVQFANACKADFALTRDGEEVWRFSEGRMFAQMISSDRFEPDETIVYDGEWADPEPGTYTAIAELRARDATCEARTECSI